MKTLAKFRFAALVAAACAALALRDAPAAWQAATNAGGFLLEVLGVLPPVMVLVGLLDVWMPRRVVERHLGPGAGLRGSLLALFLGMAAAGPIYAAFPLAVSLRAKGARTAHVVTLLGAWATIKVPMLLMEAAFVGLRFALLRLALTLPCILAMGWLMERLPGAGPRVGTDVETGAAGR